MYGILPQNVATDLNLSTSINQWLHTQVKVNYDAQAAALKLNNGYVLQSDGTWTVDTNGMNIFEGTGPTDPKLFERLPALMYQIDDAKATSSRLPVPLGCGDGANYEFIPILICCAPPPLVSDDGSAEPDILARMTLKTLMRNAILRTSFLPIVDHGQTPTGSPTPLYPQVGYAQLFDQRMIEMSGELKQMMVNNRERFDVTFTLRWPVATTNG